MGDYTEQMAISLSLIVEQLQELNGNLLMVAAEPRSECEWTLDSNEHYEIWETSCGQSWSFTDNLSLTEYNVRFCQGCGGKIKEKNDDQT